MAESKEVAAQFRAALADIDKCEEDLANPAVARMLQTDADGKPLVSNAEVPALFFNDSAEAGANIEALARLQGYPLSLDEYAWGLLREAALEPDRTFDVLRLDRWVRRHSSALSAMPSLRERIEKARAAKMEVHGVLVDYDRKRRELVEGPAGLFLDRDPAEAVRLLFQWPDTVAAMRELVGRMSEDRKAIDGLKAGVWNHIRDDVGVRNEDAGRFVSFMEAHGPALEVLFEPGRIEVLRDIELDLKRHLLVAPSPDEPTTPAPKRPRWWPFGR